MVSLHAHRTTKPDSKQSLTTKQHISTCTAGQAASRGTRSVVKLTLGPERSLSEQGLNEQARELATD